MSFTSTLMPGGGGSRGPRPVPSFNLSLEGGRKEQGLYKYLDLGKEDVERPS